MLDARESARDQARVRKQALAEEAASLRGRNEQLGPETGPIKERVATLEKATQPQCPTCGQTLSEKDRKRLVAQLNAEVEARRNQYRANAARLRAIADESAQVEQDLNAAEVDLRQRPALQKREAEWLALSLARKRRKLPSSGWPSGVTSGRQPCRPTRRARPSYPSN